MGTKIADKQTRKTSTYGY